MSIKDTVRKAAGLLFTFEPSENEPQPPVVKPRSVEDILKETPGPTLEEIKMPQPPAQPTEPVIDAAGNVRFSTIYQMAGLPETPLTAEQVLEVLASFPADLPIATQRATMKVTINAMSKSTGASEESVVADTSRKLAALNAFHDGYGKQADQYVQLAESEIQNLEAQITAKRATIQDALSKKSSVIQACTTESERLDDVLEFFSLDVAPSKHAT